MEHNQNRQDISQLQPDLEQKVDGTQIRRIRNWKGWSAKDLAEKVAVDPQHIYRIERNEARPSLSLLTKIADTLGVPIQQLFENEQDQTTILFISESIASTNIDSALKQPHRFSMNGENESSIKSPPCYNPKENEADVMLRGLKLATTENFKVKISVGSTATFDVPDHLADQFLIMLFDYSFSQSPEKKARSSFSI